MEKPPQIYQVPKDFLKGLSIDKGIDLFQEIQK